MTRRMEVDALLPSEEILATVARFAIDPRCEVCGGPAQLQTKGGHVQVVIDHRSGCQHAEEVQTRRSEA